MNLTSTLDYIIAVIGILIIVVSFAWNIYDVFISTAVQGSDASEDKTSKP